MNLYVIQEQLERIERKLDARLKDRWLGTQEVVDFTGLSVSTIHRAINRGELKVHQGTGKNLFLESDVNRWIKNGE